jgi:hypothetical protein
LPGAQRRHFVDADNCGRGVERDLAALGPFTSSEHLDVMVLSA